MIAGSGFVSTDMDKRLREVERKLDLLIQMMRQGARPGHCVRPQECRPRLGPETVKSFVIMNTPCARPR